MIAPESDTDLLAREKRAGFAAAVALYPGCVASRRTWSNTGVYQPVAPLLILIGDKDDWTPAEPCRKLTEAAQQAGYPVTIKIYPGAYHSFDSYSPCATSPRASTSMRQVAAGRRRVATRRPGPTASAKSSPSSAAICGSALPPARPRSPARQRAIRRMIGEVLPAFGSGDTVTASRSLAAAVAASVVERA
jgi:dienelactone hydrolase